MVNQGQSNNTLMSRLFNTLPKQLEDDTSDIYLSNVNSTLRPLDAH